MKARDLVLVAYDAADDARRARALAVVRAFGIHAQLSVHECLLSEAERNEMWRRLDAVLDESDRLLMLVLDPRATIAALGGPRPLLEPACVYIG